MTGAAGIPGLQAGEDVKWAGCTPASPRSINCGKYFAELSRDRQRALVESAIEVTAQLGGADEEWPLERALAVVMLDLGDP